MDKLQRIVNLKAFEPDAESEGDWELIIEANWSTPDVDRVRDIVLPTAFGKHIDEFRDNPVMMFNHDPSITIGKWFDVKLTENGPVSRGGIANTAAGRDVAKLIRAGVVTKTSFMFDVLDYEPGKDGEPNIIKEVIVFEAGPVSVPANPNAVLQIAKSKGIQLESFDSCEAGSEKGPAIMDAEKLKEVEQGLTKKVDEHLDVKVSEITEDIKSQFAKYREEVVATKGQTEAEFKAKAERMVGDFTKTVGDLETQIKEIQKRNKVNNTAPVLMKAADIAQATDSEIESTFFRDGDKAQATKQLRDLSDQMVMMDNILICDSQRRGLGYHQQPKPERMKSLRLFGRVSELAKALDTETSTEGSQFIPSELSSNLIERVLTDNPIAQQIPSITMPTPVYKLPVEGAAVMATLVAEKTTYVSAFDSVEQTPGTADTTLTARKLRVRIPLSHELDEDAVFPIMPWVMRQHEIGQRRALATAIVNGQRTGTIDTGAGIGSTDARYCWDGLRYMANAGSNETDLGTLTADTIRSVYGKMKKYALPPSDTFCLTSVMGYLRMMRDVTEVQTIDKFGPQAVIRTGTLAMFDGRSIVVDEAVAENLDSSGVYSGAGQTRTIIAFVNPNCFIQGVKRGVESWVQYDGINDIYETVTFQRRAFACFYAYATEPVVSVGFNVQAS
jgi:HK97 family phage major capsid protein/HK97 family phage prohead protease